MFDEQPPEQLPGEPEVEEAFWTVRRVLYFLIILITLIAFLIYSLLYGWITTHNRYPPQPTPTVIPLEQV